MKLKVQLSLCIAGSAVLTIITLIFTTVFAEEKGWFSFGPSSHLSIAGVVIDTREKYSVLVFSIVFNSIIDTVYRSYQLSFKVRTNQNQITNYVDILLDV
jgi:hypothetical protein